MTLCVDLLVFAYFEDASFFLIRCLLWFGFVNDYAINNNIICLVPSSLLGSFCAWFLQSSCACSFGHVLVNIGAVCSISFICVSFIFEIGFGIHWHVPLGLRLKLFRFWTWVWLRKSLFLLTLVTSKHGNKIYRHVSIGYSTGLLRIWFWLSVLRSFLLG